MYMQAVQWQEGRQGGGQVSGSCACAEALQHGHRCNGVCRAAQL